MTPYQNSSRSSSRICGLILVSNLGFDFAFFDFFFFFPEALSAEIDAMNSHSRSNICVKAFRLCRVTFNILRTHLTSRLHFSRMAGICFLMITSGCCERSLRYSSKHSDAVSLYPFHFRPFIANTQHCLTFCSCLTLSRGPNFNMCSVVYLS